MNQHQPILIAGPPRVGSTMLAGLLIKHGVWVGKAKITPYKETNSQIGTENIEIKKYLKWRLPIVYQNWNIPLPDCEYGNSFKEDILKIVKIDDPWLVKTSNLLLTWQLWNEAFPEAIWVFPERPVADIVASALRHPAMKKRGEKKITKFVGACIARQSKIGPLVKNSIVLNTPLLVRGHGNVQETMRKIIEKVGLKYDQSIVDDWIKPEMWHGKC